MERLVNKPATGINQLITKLEISIADGTITESKLDKLQKVLDETDQELKNPNYRLYELQSIIYYVRNDKTKALEYIHDALVLEPDRTKYSSTGFLLAELYYSSVSNEPENFNETESENYIEKDFDTATTTNNLSQEKSIKELRKKYSGKLEGWLALYALRLIAIPVVLLIDIGTIFSEDLTSIDGSLMYYSYAAIYIEGAIVLWTVGVWYSFFKKRKNTIRYVKILEIILAVFYFIFGVWLLNIYNEYSVTNDGEPAKLIVYGVVAFLWFAYWSKSKRVLATFIKS